MPLRQLPIDLDRESLVRTITLQPLDLEDTAQLVEALLDGPPETELVEAVHEIGGGIPFYTIEAIHALQGRGHLRRDGDGWTVQEGSGLSREQLRSRPAS